jgi:beta-N-acetylhexosaminidase
VNRRQFLVRGALVVAGGVLAACERAVATLPPSSLPSTPPPTPSPSPTLAPTATPAPAPDTELRAQIAQMLLVGFRGQTADEAAPTIADIRERGLGGVLLFDRDLPTGSAVRNIASPPQVAALTAALQATARDAGLPPLLVAVDEEGGLVERLGPPHGFAGFPSAADLGARGDTTFTRRTSADMARMLAAAGVTLNLAPVVDVNVNPGNPVIGALGRSFSADAEVVAAQAEAFVLGHRDVGVPTALKHFPGHGSSTADSHQGFVDVTDTWSDAELVPYRRLLADGAVDSVLTAHVFNANLDPDYPATLSRATVQGLLRGTLGWDGLVMSDDLQMGAIRDVYGPDEALARCIGAGVDVLLIAQQQVWEEDVVGRTIDRVVALVGAGQVSRERIAESAARIARFKAGLQA